MSETLRPATILAALALTGLLALTGCAPETPGPADPGGDPGPGTADGPGDDLPEGGLTTDVGGECLVGDWIISDSEVQGFYSAVGAASGLDISTSGTLSLDFTETRYEYTPDFSYGFTVPSGDEMSAVVTGTVSGDYSVEGGVITTVNDVSDVSVDATVMGMPFDLSELENQIISEHPINSVSYHCEDRAPVIDFIIPDGTHPVRLAAG